MDKRYALVMAQDNRQPTQRTTPKRGKPIEIPVPKRKDVEDVLKLSATRRPKK